MRNLSGFFEASNLQLSSALVCGAAVQLMCRPAPRKCFCGTEKPYRRLNAHSGSLSGIMVKASLLHYAESFKEYPFSLEVGTRKPHMWGGNPPTSNKEGHGLFAQKMRSRFVRWRLETLNNTLVRAAVQDFHTRDPQGEVLKVQLCPVDIAWVLKDLLHPWVGQHHIRNVHLPIHAVVLQALWAGNFVTTRQADFFSYFAFGHFLLLCTACWGANKRHWDSGMALSQGLPHRAHLFQLSLHLLVYLSPSSAQHLQLCTEGRTVLQMLFMWCSSPF